ncbi:hypothetical protein MJO28_010715 [Puccinia striiformis f. sp. tritici]|uniref:Integrase core domain-containing protein n=3 Tax=Puccinia striiformis TaxID=27350 RepID=A0A2S4VVV1_9BASI|nr:hypothetical protein MJO28_010715 [Puccinia striiformis f. sp. tritici]POW13636.1 hypothetical protein PSTT_03627 [Puccinia striiformis]POW15583.1 hypothetical protein PSHT_06943 [Puccinia striiformis]
MTNPSPTISNIARHGPKKDWVTGVRGISKPIGITLYGFIDGFSRKILGMYVHVADRNPELLSVHFLKLVASTGGIPIHLTTGDGHKFQEMSQYQVQLNRRYGDITRGQPVKHVQQKVQAVWTRMLRDHRSAMDAVYKQVEHGKYNATDETQRFLFQFLWIPVFQSKLDSWVADYNASRTRIRPSPTIPTGCSPDFSYSTPEHFGASNHLINVPKQEIELMLEGNHPAHFTLISTHTPAWFHEMATTIMQEMGLEFYELSLDSIWTVFDTMLPHIVTQLPLNSDFHISPAL